MATKDKEIKTASRKVIGASGTDIFSGIITEEYNPELSGIQGIKIYDEMRKSDATVRAAISACQLPIRRANWFVKIDSDDEKDIEVRNFIERALFDEMAITWDDFLRQALLMLPFGVMLFEKVFTVREVDGVNRVIWHKFAPRMPKSITHWETASGDTGVQQLATGTVAAVSIPMEKLLVFVNEIEGENWWGTSLLRAAYKHWFVKANLERIDSVAHERQGLGVPAVKLPHGHNDADVTRAENILKNLRAHEEGYLLEYDDMEVEFKDMKAHTTRDPSKTMMYHNRQIVLSVLAQFLDLGSGATGSRALSEDHTNLFLQSLEAIANSFVDVVNKFAIKELVDLNFDGVEIYPELDYNGISRVDVDKLSTAYQRFTQSGGLKPTKGDDQYVRELLGLPERTDEDEDVETEKVEDIEIEETTEELGMSELLRKKKISTEEIEKALDKRLEGMGMAEQIDLLLGNLKSMRGFKKHQRFFSVATGVLGDRYDKLTWRYFQENNDFKGWRPLTFAEKKVNFKSIQSQMDKLEGELTDKSRKLLQKEKDVYLAKLMPAIQKKDVAKIKELEIAFLNSYTKLLNDLMQAAYTFGKNNAAREMGLKAQPSNADVLRSITISADNIAAKHTQQLTSEAKTVLADRLAKGESPATIAGAVDAAIVKVIEKVTRDTSAVVIAGHINLGRKTVFDRNASKIFALQRSEILDSKTCNYCLSIDERIIEKTDPLAKIGTFHSNCRGIWVEILEAEENKPNITGVPNSLRDRIGDATNELTQPPKPIVKKNTPAERQAKKREK
jgi:hypothetical protein